MLSHRVMSWFPLPSFALLWMVAGGVLVSPHAVRAEPARVVVYKTPTCGCCKAWVEHLRTNGFEVTTEDLQDLSLLKQQHRVPQKLQTCHTALVDGYVVEGHVPASDLKRLLAERPKVAGIAVPGMPIGSPGMEMRGRGTEAYETLTFTAGGATTVFERHLATPPPR